MSQLSEAVERFRVLAEASIKPGDYVTAPDGQEGFVTAVNGNMVAFNWVQYKQTKQVYMPANVLHVNPGGPPR